MRNVFPVLEIAQKLTSTQMKTEAIISGMIFPHTVETVKVSISFCEVTTDARNHHVLKIFPVLFSILIGKRVDCKQNCWMFTVNLMKEHK
jgi:hypothetical protein